MKTEIAAIQLELQSQFPDLEAKRRLSRKFYNLAITLAIFGLVAFLIVILQKSVVNGLIAFAGLILFIVVVHFITLPRVKYERYFDQIKAPFLNQLLKLIDGSIEYKKDKLPASEIAKTSLFKDKWLKEETLRIDDYFEGNYNSVDFKIAEIDFGFSSVHKVDSFIPSVLFIAEFNKALKFETYIKETNFFKQANNKTKHTTSILTAPKGEYIMLEDPVFRHNFNSYSTDAVEGRYVLTFTMMDRILSVKELMGNKTKLYISFRENQVAFLLYNKCIFEPCLSKSITDDKLFEKFYFEIKAVLEIIDELRLNDRIWVI